MMDEMRKQVEVYVDLDEETDDDQDEDEEDEVAGGLGGDDENAADMDTT